MSKRKVVLDTETTGINKFGNYYEKHKIIEIGAIEIINRKITGKNFHVYINPKRNIEKEAYNIHGINNEFLINKPIFCEIYDKFIEFIYKSELIIHNAKFDIDFINYELSLINKKIKDITKICKITDSLIIAKNKFPGKRNNLDALCERYKIKKNKLHGALTDSEVLAKVFLLLTGGQSKIKFDNYNNKINNNICNINKFKNKILNLKIIYANNDEILRHKNFLQYIKKKYRLNLI